MFEAGWDSFISSAHWLLCHVDDPIFLTFLVPLTLFPLAIMRSISVRDGHHPSLHLMVGSDLVMAITAACIIQALIIFQRIQCVGLQNKPVDNLLIGTLTVALCTFLLLMVCFKLERVAFNDKKASLWRVLWNILLGLLATALAVGVLSQQLVKM